MLPGIFQRSKALFFFKLEAFSSFIFLIIWWARCIFHSSYAGFVLYWLNFKLVVELFSYKLRKLFFYFCGENYQLSRSCMSAQRCSVSTLLNIPWLLGKLLVTWMKRCTLSNAAASYEYVKKCILILSACHTYLCNTYLPNALDDRTST